MVLFWKLKLRNNNNNEYLKRLTRTGPKRLHILYKYVLSKFNAYNMNARALAPARTHTHTHTHARTHAHTHTHTHTHNAVILRLKQWLPCLVSSSLVLAIAGQATEQTVDVKLQALVYDILPGGGCRKAMLGVWVDASRIVFELAPPAVLHVSNYCQTFKPAINDK